MPETKEQELDSTAFFEDLRYYRNVATGYREARFSAEWNENTAFYFGDQYTQDYVNSLARWRSISKTNIIYPTVEQLHALLTDDQTIAFVERAAGGSFTVQKVLDSIIKQVWGKSKITAEISKADKDRLMWGTSFFKVWRDEFSEKLLKIDAKRISPWDLFPDPVAKEIQDCRFIFERERTTKSAEIQKHPEMYEAIMAADGNAGNAMVDEGNSANSSMYEPEILYVWHCYVDDLIHFERNSEDLSEAKIKDIKKRFPNGRYVKMLGDIVLSDGPNDLPFKPYIRMPLIEIPDEMFGMSIVTPMKDPQEELNKTNSMLLDNLKSNVNPMIKVTEGMFDLDEFVPLPNSVVTVRNADDVFEKVPGTQLPSEVFAVASMKKEETQAAAGVNDVTFGAGAQSSRPGTVKANFQASITRVREYVRLKHAAIGEIGEFIIKIVQLHTPKDTIITLADPDRMLFNADSTQDQDAIMEGIDDPLIAKNLELGDITLNEFPPDFKEQLDAAIKAGGGEEIFTRGEAEELLLRQGITKLKNDTKDGEYQYVVKTHPITVKDPDSLLELFTVLMQYGSADPSTGSPGIIDAEFVLDHIELDGKAALKQRLKAKERQMLERLNLEAQAAAGQPQPQGAPQ